MNTKVGKESVLSLRAGSTQVIARVGADLRSAFPVGSSVTFVGNSPDSTGQGTISAISEFRQADDTPNSIPGYDLTIDVTSLHDITDRTTVTVHPATGATSAQPGLAVPVTAIHTDGAASSINIVVPRSEGASATEGTQTIGTYTYRSVPVKVVTTQDGYSWITGDGLEAGQQVLLTAVP